MPCSSTVSTSATQKNCKKKLKTFLKSFIRYSSCWKVMSLKKSFVVLCIITCLDIYSVQTEDGPLLNQMTIKYFSTERRYYCFILEFFFLGNHLYRCQKLSVSDSFPTLSMKVGLLENNSDITIFENV